MNQAIKHPEFLATKELDEVIKHPELLAIKWFSKGIRFDEELEASNPVRKELKLYLDLVATEGVSAILDLRYSAFGHIGNIVRIISFDEDEYPSWVDIKILKGHPMYRPGMFG